MNIRISFLKLAVFASLAASAAFSSASAQAAKNRGQLVQAIVKLNNAQLAFAKKLAEDPQFSAQFDQATQSGKYDAAASLAASVTGLSRSEIYVGPGSTGGDDDHEAASATSTKSVYQLASFAPSRAKKFLSGKICFRTFGVEGCIEW
jgi:hypothetical protein